MYLFDERVPEYYLDRPCETWDALYENLPLCETRLWNDNEGLVLDRNGTRISVEKIGEGTLAASWDGKRVIFSENGIKLFGIDEITFDTTSSTAHQAEERDFRRGDREDLLPHRQV